MSEQRLDDGSRPGADDVVVPSAAVLDELLHAFGAAAGDAETSDAERLARIDLTSPEVEELIHPSRPTPPPEDEAEAQLLRQVREAPQPEDEPEEGSAAAIDPLLHPTVPDEAPSEPEATGGRTIVIAAEDGLPDAVTVAGSLEPGAGVSAADRVSAAGLGADASTVFIDDTAGAGRADATSATKIEPRFRQRRIAVRRARGRRRLRWIIAATVVVLLVVGGLAVLGSSWFAIADVEVDGATYSRGDVLDAVVEDLRGSPVLRADTERAEAELEAIPWVLDARVTTEFPNGARIEIREREPVVAFEGPDQRFRVIDRQGRVLEIVQGQPVEYLRLNSPNPPDVRPGASAPSGYSAAASLVDALTPSMRALARSVSVTPDGSDLRLQLVSGAEVRFGRGDDLINKLVRLQTILTTSEVERPSLIDVSTAQVVVR